jgi:hypothetical protein
MNEVSTFRLYLLRALYALMAVGLAFEAWPAVLRHAPETSIARGSLLAMLAAIQLLAIVGIRHPIRMLPLLLFELVWKMIWLLAFAWPSKAAGAPPPGLDQSVFACLLGVVIVPLALPWGYVLRHYVRGPGDKAAASPF